MPRKAAITILVLAAALVAAPIAAASPSANTAALQVALRALHRYNGVVDGIAGPKTKRGLKAFQRAHHLVADGIAGPKTRRALGRRGRPALGSRIMHKGERGWDIAGLQFLLRRRGFSPRTIDGGFGPRTLGALERFQRAAHIGVDGRAGRQTLSALRHRAIRRRGGHSSHTGTPTGPVRFLRPVPGPIGDGFGYPGGRRHDGVDFPEPYGTPIGAAGVGTVIFAGWNSGGYGNLTIIQHRLDYQTWYAHQSSILVHVGDHVAGGVKIGLIGATGHATGPHLHFEVRHHGIPVNPVPYLLSRTSLGKRIFGRPIGHCMDRDQADTPLGGPLPPLQQSPDKAVLSPC